MSAKANEQQAYIDDMNHALEELRVHNKQLNTEKNMEAIERLNLKEENLILKDLLEQKQVSAKSTDKSFEAMQPKRGGQENLANIERINRDAMMTNIREMREYILNAVKIDRDRLHTTLDAQEAVSQQFLSRFQETNKQHQRVIEVLTCMQDKIEVNNLTMVVRNITCAGQSG